MDRKSECRGVHDYMEVGGRATKGAVAEGGARTAMDRMSECRGAQGGARTAIPALHDEGQDVQMSRSTGRARATVPTTYMDVRVPREDRMSGAAVPYGASLPRRRLRYPAFRGTCTSLCI